MINNQDSSQETTNISEETPKVPKDKTKITAKRIKTRDIWIGASCLLVVAIVICLVYFANAGKKPQAGVPAENATASSITMPVSPVTPPAEEPAPPSTPSPSDLPETPVATPSPESLPTPQPPAVSAIGSDTLILRQAYQMVLTLNDMGSGWTSGNAGSPPRTRAFSSSHVAYTQGVSFSPIVQNTVTVYRTIDAAITAFDADRPPASVVVSYPNIGDECFLNDSVPMNKILVFRKNNVVAWITIQQDKSNDPEKYARIVEQKITP